MPAHPQSTTTTSASAAASRQCRSGCGCVGRLMKKLKKESHKMLCLAPRPVAFDCRYDPLSYARNFDGGDDSHLPYAFASRFVAAAKTPLVQGNNVTR